MEFNADFTEQELTKTKKKRKNKLWLMAYPLAWTSDSQYHEYVVLCLCMETVVQSLGTTSHGCGYFMTC